MDSQEIGTSTFSLAEINSIIKNHHFVTSQTDTSPRFVTTSNPHVLALPSEPRLLPRVKMVRLSFSGKITCFCITARCVPLHCILGWNQKIRIELSFFILQLYVQSDAKIVISDNIFNNYFIYHFTHFTRLRLCLHRVERWHTGKLNQYKKVDVLSPQHKA